MYIDFNHLRRDDFKLFSYICKKENILELMLLLNCTLLVLENHSNGSKIISTPLLLLFLVIIFTLLAAIIFIYSKYKSILKELYSYQNKNLIDREVKDEIVQELANDYLETLRNTALLESYLPEDERKYGLRILKKMYDAVFGKKTFPWEKAYNAISILYDQLPERLRSAYPELDEAEIRLCCLTYMDINNTEIATIMRFKINTIQAKKSVIRKKLGIEGYGNIRDFLTVDLDNRQSKKLASE